MIARIVAVVIVFPDRMRDVFGVDADKLPSVAVDTNPGDLIVLNFRTVHASFAGTGKRRLININYKDQSKHFPFLSPKNLNF